MASSISSVIDTISPVAPSIRGQLAILFDFSQHFAPYRPLHPVDPIFRLVETTKSSSSLETLALDRQLQRVDSAKGKRSQE